MRFLPRSLFGQIVLALVAGIVVAQLAGAWLLLDDRSRFGDRLRREYAAQRIAGIISVLDAAPAEERPRLVRACCSTPSTRCRCSRRAASRCDTSRSGASTPRR